MIEAPTQEPRDLQGPDGVSVEVVSRTFRTKRGEVAALAGMSLRADAGEIVAVVGPSGCGKTTLLELICGLQTPDSGNGRRGAGRADAPARPAAAVAERARQRRPGAARPRRLARAGARARPRRGSSASGWRSSSGPGRRELSGGMRQRVSFLRTLLAGKPVLALDEPFAALDAITRAEMQGWLAHVLASEPRTVVLVTHDVEEAVVLADRVVVMSPRPGRAVAEIEVDAAAAAPAHRRRRRRAARARARRAGGATCMTPARELAGARRWCCSSLLGAWELYVDVGGADPLILPAPHPVAKALYTDRSLLWSNFLVTAREVLLGIALAAAAGLAFAVAIHFSPTLRRAVYPLLVASQTVPVAMLAPVLVFWLGFGILPKLVVIALVSFFSIVVTTLAGLAAVDPDLLKLMRTFDASRAQHVSPRRVPVGAARRVHRAPRSRSRSR